MKFETKFNYGQMVYAIINDEIRKVGILGIKIDFRMDENGNPDINIKYDIFEYENEWKIPEFPENKLFETKEELINYLFTKAENL